MKTKIYVLAIICLIGFSCKQKADTDISLVKETIKDKSINHETDSIIDFLNSYSQIKVDTNLVASKSNMPLNEITKSDWIEIEKLYESWRKDKIAKGIYSEDCFFNDEETHSEVFKNIELESLLRYMLPKIGINDFSELYKNYNSNSLGNYPDTCLLIADVNFDGKLDVILQIRPIDCLQGWYCNTSPLYLAFLSGENEYKFDNTFIDKLRRVVIDDFSERISSMDYYWFRITDISVENGLITFTGSSTIYLENDGSCCPSIIFDYECFMDKSGKGYVCLNGTYEYGYPEEESKFKITLPIK